MSDSAQPPRHIRHISTDGIFFRTDAAYPVGSVVTLTISLDFGGTRTKMVQPRFQAEGRVVRAEANGVFVAFDPRNVEAARFRRPGRNGDATPPRIAVVSETPLLNDLLTARICQETGANCSYSASLPQIMAVSAPDLTLVDCAGMTVAKKLEFIARENFSARYAYMAFFNVQDEKSADMEGMLIDAGVRGIFYRDVSFSLLLKGLRSILTGQLWFSREAMSRCLGGRQENGEMADACSDKLSQREKEILLMLAAGASNQDIADKLFLSLSTIKSHIYNIYKKIGVPNRSQAALWASRCLGPEGF